MQLEKLTLFNFKNYNELHLDCSPHINSIVGANGSGKTNLLDAIYYLSLTKSAFNNIDFQNIRHNQSFFMIKGTFKTFNKFYEIQCNFQKGQKKTIKHDKKNYDKISDHIGKFPVVLIAPFDIDIIREGSELRRKFFDGILAQLSTQYLNNLLAYQQILRQRNALLKQFFEKNKIDHDLLTPYDHRLIETGALIFQERENFIEDFLPVFQDYYGFLTDSREAVNLKYVSDFANSNFQQIFTNNIEKDLALQRTGKGVHKDDIHFSINDYPLKKFGSQGQQKSFIVALKLAQFDFIKQKKGFKPILLMDDIFDKLDEARMNKLMQLVSNNTFGQLFITDARPERTNGILENLSDRVKTFHINHGKIT